MTPWEAKQTTSKPESRKPWFALEAVAPVSSQVPYTNPNKIVEQSQAQQQQAAEQFARTQTIAATREQHGPLYAGSVAGSNELMQPVIGAARLPLKISGTAPRVNERLGNISKVMEGHTQQLRDAYPVETSIGQMAPYALTGPAASGLYMKGVSKLAPGFWTQNMGRTLPSSIIPGAVEGGLMAGLNPYQDWKQGALAGAGGNYVGQMIMGPLSKGATNLTAYQKDMGARAKQISIPGFERKSLHDYWWPAAKTGNIGNREIDDALAANPDAMNAIGHMASTPRLAYNYEVFKNAGLDETIGDALKANNYNVTSGLWTQHKAALGKTYDMLENQSKPIYTADIGINMVQAKRAFDDLVDPFQQGTNQAAKDWAKGFSKKIMSMVNPRAHGRNLDRYSIDPLAWRGLQNELKTTVNSLNKIPMKNEQQVAQLSYAQDMLEVFRDMMRTGATNKKLLDQWKKTDMQFSLTKFLEENKVIQQGNVDVVRLYKAFQAKAPGVLTAPNKKIPWSRAGNAAELGNYAEEMKDATLGMRGLVNEIMGSRQKKKGVFGTLTQHGSKFPFFKGLGAATYVANTPRKGLLRLPQTSPIFGGPAIGSAPARGLFMDRESP